MNPNTTQAFVSTGAMHVTTLLGCAALIAGIVFLGKRSSGRGQARGFTKGLAFFALGLWGVTQTYGFLPAHFEGRSSFPFQWCDVSALIAPLALLTGRRALRAVTYFWAFAFAPVAFATPTLDEGPGHPMFWFFWLGHSMIIACALHDIVVLGFRPGWRDFGINSVIAAGYVVFLLLINIPTGWNYGFVGASTPDVKTPIDALGAWPLRVVWLCLVAHVVFVVLIAPWRLWAWFQRRAVGQEEAPKPSELEGAS